MINEHTTESKNAAGSIIFVVIMAGISYSILRYHLVGSMPWKVFPTGRFANLAAGLPPVSLAAFLIFMVGHVFNLIGGK